MSQIIKTLPKAKRHVIEIDDMTAAKRQYQSDGYIRTGNLISDTEQKISSIAIFCNEYLPDKLLTQTDAVKYILTVNDVDHEIVPINSNKNGVKIIKQAKTGDDSNYALYINESIKSAVLTISMKSRNSDLSPYLSSIKVLFGV
jgi:hypothetical protein